MSVMCRKRPVSSRWGEDEEECKGEGEGGRMGNCREEEETSDAIANNNMNISCMIASRLSRRDWLWFSQGIHGETERA